MIGRADASRYGDINMEAEMPNLATAAPVVPDRTTLNILHALARGATTADAAVVCNISGSTLRRKLSFIRDEWGVDSNVQAVVIAVRRGLI
jgi:DNA-binding NarL/FixJ family response regulator